MEKFVIASAALAWFLAQGIKTLLALRRGRHFDPLHALTATGGMPSSHAAFVTGLCVAIFHSTGLSLPFVLSLALAILTIRDALVIRTNLDRHAHVLNQVLATGVAGAASAQPPLPTNAGHRPHEALCGMALGLLAVLILVQLRLF